MIKKIATAFLCTFSLQTALFSMEEKSSLGGQDDSLFLAPPLISVQRKSLTMPPPPLPTRFSANMKSAGAGAGEVRRSKQLVCPPTPARTPTWRLHDTKENRELRQSKVLLVSTMLADFSLKPMIPAERGTLKAVLGCPGPGEMSLGLPRKEDVAAVEAFKKSVLAEIKINCSLDEKKPLLPQIEMIVNKVLVIKKHINDKKATITATDTKVPWNQKYKPSGTAIIKTGKISSRTTARGHDNPFGRWSTIFIGTPMHSIAIVTTYIVCTTPILPTKTKTAAYQQ